MTVLRSFLYVPATRPERFAKAVDAGAHAVIVDLEDAVAPADKAPARARLHAELAALRAHCDAAGCELLVRPNARHTPWHEEDIEALAAWPVHGVVVPKPDDAQALAALHARLGAQRALYLLVESLRGFRHVEAIAGAPGVRQLMLGAADLMLDIGTTQDDAPLHHYRALLVMHSRLAGLPPPVDGVCLGLEDAALLAREIARAKDFGFGAKLCVHPHQVVPVHEGFGPTALERVWAERVVSAAGSAQGAAVRVDGRLVDAPLLEQARRLLAGA